MWIRLLKDVPDEGWNMRAIWHELTSRRAHEEYIGYAESHDQALVGDKTIMFRLCDSAMYTDMSKFVNSAVIDRGIALHKMIRLLTMSLAGEGYLSFMGNEFGHPEWIDFPREGNGWSYDYCRRQWHLADDGTLKYSWLLAFDRAMVSLAKDQRVFDALPVSLYIDDDAQTLVYERNGLLFAFNFSPSRSYPSYFMCAPDEQRYHVVLSTDEKRFGGWDRISPDTVYTGCRALDGRLGFPIYLPARTALVLRRVHHHSQQGK